MKKIMKRNKRIFIQIGSVVGLIVVVVVNILLVIFIYFNVAAPLRKVNDGVREYMEKKDSNAALLSMAAVRSRNEVGRLADSFSEMSREIERYTEENLRLGNERECIAAELNLAANIQASQLPSKFPAFPDRDEFDIFASMTPAKEVGGDFYDFFMIDGDHLGLVIADVSGKGVPAALFMMISKMMIKNFAMSGFSPTAAQFPVTLADGKYDADIVGERISPIKFLLK